MIDRDEMRIARRTVERNGYTVLPPREKDEEDLTRYRSRRDMERRPVRPVHDEDDDYEERQPRFKPLRSRPVEDEEPVRRPVRRPVEDDFDDDFEFEFFHCCNYLLMLFIPKLLSFQAEARPTRVILGASIS